MIDHLNWNRSFELILLERFLYSISYSETAKRNAWNECDQKGKWCGDSTFAYFWKSRNMVANNAIIHWFIRRKSVASEILLLFNCKFVRHLIVDLWWIWLIANLIRFQRKIMLISQQAIFSSNMDFFFIFTRLNDTISF